MKLPVRFRQQLLNQLGSQLSCIEPTFQHSYLTSFCLHTSKTATFSPSQATVFSASLTNSHLKFTTCWSSLFCTETTAVQEVGYLPNKQTIRQYVDGKGSTNGSRLYAYYQTLTNQLNNCLNNYSPKNWKINQIGTKLLNTLTKKYYNFETTNSFTNQRYG